MKHTNQLDFFYEEINQEDYEEDYEKDFKICYTCNESLSISFFQYTDERNKWRRRDCTPCRKKYQKILGDLRKKHIVPNNHKCPICLTNGKNSIGKRTVWELDHCHITDKFRNYLCGTCNRGLGFFKDDLENIKKALEYLNKHKENL